MTEIEWHQLQAILVIDGYVETEFDECFRQHWYSSAYKGCECNNDFKKSVAAFVNDYVEMLGKLKAMVEALPDGRELMITVSEEEDEVV